MTLSKKSCFLYQNLFGPSPRPRLARAKISSTWTEMGDQNDIASFPLNFDNMIHVTFTSSFVAFLAWN